MAAAVLASISLLASPADAEILSGFDVNGRAGNQVTETGTVAAANMNTAAPYHRLTRGSGVAGTAVASSFSSTGWAVGGTNTSAVTSNDYVTVRVAPNAGYTITVTNFSIGIRRSGSGPTNWMLRSSVDNFASDLATILTTSDTAISNFVTTITGHTSLTGVEFRVYGYRAGLGTGVGRTPMDGSSYGSAGIDLAVFGTVNAAASPDIAIRGNGTLIADGDATPVVTDDTDYNAVGVNQSNIVHTFTVTNTGAATLILQNVAIGGTHPGDFAVASALGSTSLAAGASTTFSIRFDPTAAGTRTATIYVSNNVTGKNPYDFVIQGTGVLAGILRNPTTINITTMVGSAPANQNFGVTNVGRGRLDYTISTNVGWLSVSPSAANLAETAGQQETVSISVTGLHAGVSNATITISSSVASNTPQTVAVTLTLTNIPAPTAQSAATDGREMIRLAWTKPAAHNVLIAYQQGSAPGTPANGTAYTVGAALPGGGNVLYIGAGAALEHVVRTNASHFYKFFSINTNHYSLAASADTNTQSYGDGEIVEPFAYTNGVSLSGQNGGNGWSGAWSIGSGTWTAETVSLNVETNYPTEYANRVRVADPGNGGQPYATRSFAPRTSGKLYFGAIVGYQYQGPYKFAGFSMMSNTTEKVFVGKIPNSENNRFGLTGSRNATDYTVSGVTLGDFNTSTGNYYLIVATYDFSTREFKAIAYPRTTVVPSVEPGTWDISRTLAAGAANSVDGVRLASGALGVGDGTIGQTLYDEVRVATNWSELLRLVAEPEIAVRGTNGAELSTTNTPLAANGTDFGATPVTGGTVDRTLTITNAGAAALSVTAITTSGTHAANFQIITPASLPLTISPSTSSNLVIRFDPDSSGLRTAAVTVVNNDSDEGNYLFYVHGTGAVAASVTTVAPTVTNTTSMTVGGNVTADGGLPVTNRGAVFKTTAGVTIADNKTVSGTPTGLGAYTVSLSGLAVNTFYYYAAYAENAAGAALGSELTFWTLANTPSAPTVGGATATSLNVTVNENGNPTSTLFSIQVTNNNLYVQTNGTLGATEHWRTDSAWGTIAVTGLGSGSNYGFHVRAQNGAGTTSAWSAVGNGTTLATTATVTTTVANPTNATTAVSGGNVTADGGATVTNRGVVWAVSPATPTVPGSQTTNGTGTGSFSSTLTNLTPGQTYNYRAFAQNSAGTSYGTTLTLTTPCFTGVVTGVIASATNDTDFTAAWTPFDGASGYQLDVSTSATFSAGAGGGSIYSNTWEGASKGAYASGTVAIAGMTWWMHDALIGTSGSDRKNGSNSARVQNSGTIGMQTSTNMGLSSITLLHAIYGSDGSSAGRVEYSTDGWATWSTAGTFTASSTSLTAFEATNLNVTGSVAVRIIKTSGGGNRYNIDDITLYPYASSPSYVPGYSNRAVSGASQSVTGLSAGATYYFRVRATNEFCATGNSSTGVVTTLVIAPDIDVFGNGTLIADNDTTPSVTDHTDFGAIGLVGSNLVRTFTITNDGNATLTLQNVAIGGAHPGDFTIIAQPSLSIPAGTFTNFQVRFDPTASGTRTATIFITNNVGAKSPYNFDIQGTGVQAGIVRSPTSFTLTTMVGTIPAAQNFGVTNAGRGQLVYTISTNASWLSVSPTGATLSETAGQQHTVTFNVTGLVAGVSNATITITDANASNSPQTVSVAITFTNIPSPTAVVVTNDGPELNRLSWTPPSGLEVLVVHNATNPPTPPTQGTSYSLGGSVGTDGSRVIYKGSATALQHVVQPGVQQHYAFYAINNNHYSPGVASNVVMASYPPNQTIDQFAYTNGVSLNGIGGGVLWTNAWSDSNPGSFTITNFSLPSQTNYPLSAANMVLVTPPSPGDRTAFRNFAGVTNGRIYVGFALNIQYNGPNKYSGISFVQGTTEEMFFGEAFAGDEKLGVGGTVSTSNLLAGIGNDYIVIGMYDFTADVARVVAYKVGSQTVPEAEPTVWHASFTDSTISRIDGIRLASGASAGTPGQTLFDEIRVATNWNGIIPSSGDPGIGVSPTNFVLSIMRGSSPGAQSFGVTNIGAGILNHAITTNVSWLSVSPVSGTLGAGAGQQHTITFATAALEPGVSNALITITDGAATNSPRTVAVQVTITNIPAVASLAATPDGAEMIRLSRTASDLQMLVLHNTNNVFTDPTQGTPYSVGDSLGSATVIFKGTPSGFEHIVPVGSTNFYRAFQLNNDYYASGVTIGATVGVYRATEIVEPFSYTNAIAMASPAKQGGNGFTNAWTVGLGTWTVVSNAGVVTFPNIPEYPTNFGNRVRLSNPGVNSTGRMDRYFPAVTTGSIYIASILSYELEGTRKFAGLSFLNAGVETGFVGKVSDDAYSFTLGIDTYGGAKKFAAFDLRGIENSTGNIYLVIGRYDFATKELRAKAYYRTDSVPLIEPAEWGATATVSGAGIARIDGVRIQAGADAGGYIGDVYFDEVRVATNWGGLLNREPPVVTTTIASSTTDVSAVSGGNVTSEGGASVTNRGVVYGTSPVPTVFTNRVVSGSGAGVFTSTLTNLVPGQTYYYRAYAQNGAGTAYGAEYTLVVPCFTSVVTGLFANPTNTTDFTANWTAVPGASSYRLDVSTTTNFVSPGLTSLAFQGFEGTSTDTWAIAAGAGSVTNLPGASDSPANARIRTGSWSWQPNELNFTDTLDLGDVDLLGYNSVTATVRISATDDTGNGLDTGDRVEIYVALNGAAFGSGPTVVIRGNSNARWDYSASGVASTVVGSPITNGPSGGGLRTTDGYATVRIGIPDGTASAKIRVVATVDGASEYWNIDDILLNGIPSDYVAGYSNRVVAGTSQSVTGLTSGVTYYWRVRPVSEACTGGQSATGIVTTVDNAAPLLYAFNVSNATNTDGAIRAGFAVTGLVFDAGAGVSNGATTPWYLMRNNLGTIVVSSNKFDTAPTNGTRVAAALADTFPGVAYADVTLGVYTALVGAVDRGGFATTSNFFLTVVDDDTAAPTISSADIDYGGVGSRYFALTTNATPVTVGNRGGTFTTVWYNVTDAELNEANARDLRFAFGIRDAGSGIARGTSGTTNTVMSFSIGSHVVGNFTNFSAALSSANYTNARTTNVWTFPAGFFTSTLINNLMTTSNRVAVTVPDDDDDRAGDASVLYDQTMGWLGVIDDDAAAPTLSSVRIGPVGGSGSETTVFTESMFAGTGGTSGDSIATHESNNRFENDGFTMSGTGDMRTTSSSTTGEYSFASGTWNVMLNASGEDFQMSDINASGYENLRLVFGVRKNTLAEDGSGLTVEVSSNGTSWVTLTIPALPTGSGTAQWYARTNTAGVIPAATNLRIRFTSTATTEWRLDDVHLVATLPAVSDLTDGALASGVALTGLVQDAFSGIYGTNTTGAFAPTVTVFNTSGTAVYGARITSGPANGVTTLSAFSNLVTLAPGDIAIGATFTSRVVVTDFDQDRTGDQLAATNQIAFRIIDDDTNAPAISGFRLNGGGTTFDTGAGNLVITGLLVEADSSVFASGGYAYFRIFDNTGAPIFSNNLYAGSGSAVTGTYASPLLTCGITYTVLVYAADSDLDRGVPDQLSSVSTALVFNTTGAGGVGDYPVATNLLVNGAAASPAVQITDQALRTGGWSMAMTLAHPVGIFTNASSPSFRVTNSIGVAITSTPFTVGSTAAVGRLFFTNASMPAVAYTNVATGITYIVWSASNQGDCVASVIDRAVIAAGTNVFTVVDDDTSGPVASAFSIVGGVGTIDVATALSGFAVTGLLQDAGSGIGFTSQPPYFLFLSTNGTVLASNVVTVGAEGSGLASPASVSNWFSGLIVDCGSIYTIRVFAADADNDRSSDRTSAIADALVVTIGGAGGAPPEASNFLVNNTAAGSVTIFDEQIATGGWRAALSFTHSSGSIVTNGPGAPTFQVLNATGTHIYASPTLSWSTIVKSVSTYYATNFPMPAASTNLVTTGVYSMVWSAQSEGLCFGSASSSPVVSPGTNTFTVTDDDTIPPNFAGLSVAGGTGVGLGSGTCIDPSRTNLVAGDIAIFAMNTKTRGTTNNDSFAFVTLVDVPTGTRIKFTDNGWKSSTASFRNNEGTITWMATSCVPAGTVIRWIATNNPTVNNGLIVATNGSFAPNIEGEQILAYQGPDSSPNFLYAVNDRLEGIWDVDSFDSHSSAIPPGLIDGYTAVAAVELDNIILNTNNLTITGDRLAVLYYIGDAGNWIGSDDEVYDLLQFNFSFPDVNSAGGAITDGDILSGGWSITGLVQDIGSGLAVSNGVGLRYSIFNTNDGLVASSYFATTFGQGDKLLQAFSNGIVAGTYAQIQIGTYTARVSAGDADADRPNDAAERVTNVAFQVFDDDVDFPQIGSFFMNGKTTITNAAELVSIVLSGTVRDVDSGIAFATQPPTFEVLDSVGTVAFSGGFTNRPTTDGAGIGWTNIWTAPINLAGIADCGTYTVKVYVADADNDRPNDRRSTNIYFLINVATGSGDEPTATNLLVNASPATNTSLTDAQIAAGGWSLALTFRHPQGLRVDSPLAPSYDIVAPSLATVITGEWTNLVTSGAFLYATNDGLPGVAYANVQTGYHHIYWSAQSLGACYGVATDSGLIGGGTNRILVVDDDSAGPTAATNVTSSAMNWTNNPVVTFTWSTATVADASGVASFRITTNGMAPTSSVDGISVGLTTAYSVVLSAEGVVTNWLFAIDADNDRANDGAMGVATGVVALLDFTAPSQVTSFAASPGAIDDTSEIDLSWSALQDAGNSNLSPWLTYRVYYTQDAGDPTTNDAYVDSSQYPDLGTNSTATFTLPNLVMGSEYRVAIAGLDRAGNLGQISATRTVLLSQIIITQAFANALSQPVIRWLGTPTAFYDVIYADATSYGDLDSVWRLAKTVLGTEFVDDGGVDEGSSFVRGAPMSLPDGMMRFYRVSPVNAWIPTASRLGGATTQIVVALKQTLTNGYNFVGMGMTPMVNTLGDFLGTNRLPAGGVAEDSTLVEEYDTSPSAQPNANPYWLSLTGWVYQIGGSNANGRALPYPLKGYNVTIPTNLSIVKTNLLLVGRVPWTNYPGVTLQPTNYHLVSMNSPRLTMISEIGIRTNLTRGSSILNADEIRILQRGANAAEATPRARIYVNLSTQFWYHTGGSGSAENFTLRADDALWIYTRKLPAAVQWNPSIPYEFPKVQITNALAAAPTVVAQQPVDITTTSALLRGLVSPNRRSTTAYIQYGTTTNYGSQVAITSLPATNIQYQLSATATGLAPATLYHFRVFASNVLGFSRGGTGVFATVGYCTNAVPSAPAVTAADGTSTVSVALTWVDGTGEDGYQIWRNTANNTGTASYVASTPANQTAYSDTSATPGQQYYYWLKATNCAGSSVFGAVDLGYRKLASVASVTASDGAFTGKVAVTWTDISGETGYTIWRHTADVSGSASVIGSVAADVLSYDDTTAGASTTYYYWVRGTNTTSGSQGDFSPSDSGYRTAVALPVLSAPTATSITSTSAVLGAHVDSFGGTLFNRGTVWGTSPAPTGNELSEGGTTTGVFSHTRTALTPGTLIYYRGWATNAGGKAYSSDGSFWTAPAAPVLLPSILPATNGLTVVWSPATGATNYLVEAANNPSLTGATTNSAGNTTSYLVNSLSGTAAYWRIRAQNSGGFSPYSATSNRVLVAAEPTTQASGLFFTSITNTSMTVHWTNGSGAARMLVGRQGGAVSGHPVDGSVYTASTVFASGTDLGGGSYVLYNGTASTTTVTGLSSGQAYFFRVYEIGGTNLTSNYKTNNATGNPGGASTL